ITKKLGLNESQSTLRRLVTGAVKRDPATSKVRVSPTPMPSVLAIPSSTESSGFVAPLLQNFPAITLLSARRSPAHERLNSRSTSRRARSSLYDVADTARAPIASRRPRTIG